MIACRHDADLARGLIMESVQKTGIGSVKAAGCYAPEGRSASRLLCRLGTLDL